MRVSVHNFEKGLWMVGGKEHVVPGFMRRARGMHAIRTPSLRSRNGSTLLYALTALALYRYNDVRFQATATNLYRNGISILSGLNGNRPAFVAMPPQAGIFDSLFVAGAGLARKVDSGGGVQNWGIVAPGSDFLAADAAAGAMGAGTYKYRVTFLNSATGSRSNANPNDVSLTIGANRQVLLTQLPVSADAQVTRREVYRTSAGGARFFRIATITDNTTTTYADNAADGSATIASFELQFDNDPPKAAYQDAWGPVNGVMWWCRDSTPAAQGRAYYSPPSRPESVLGFVEVTNPDDLTQTGFYWNEQNWVMTEKTIYRIIGDAEPYVPRAVQGVPGTNRPHTVKVTPMGVLYQALDGVRLFDGRSSRLIGFQSLGPLFQGEALENLTAFEGVVADYSKGEYFISDGVQTLALNLETETWRDLGVGCTAIYQETDTRHKIASFGGNVYSLEDYGLLNDGGAAVPLEWEMGGNLADIVQQGIIQRIFLDLDTTGQAITPALVIDGAVTNYPNIAQNGRGVVEWSVGKPARLMSLRLSGNLTNKVELFGMELDVHVPGGAPAPGRG